MTSVFRRATDAGLLRPLPAAGHDIADFLNAAAIGIGDAIVGAAAVAVIEKAAPCVLERVSLSAIGLRHCAVELRRHLPVERSQPAIVAHRNLAARARVAAVEARPSGRGRPRRGSRTRDRRRRPRRCSRQGRRPGSEGSGSAVYGGAVGSCAGFGGVIGCPAPTWASVASGVMIASALLSISTSRLESAARCSVYSMSAVSVRRPPTTATPGGRSSARVPVQVTAPTCSSWLLSIGASIRTTE